MITTRWLLLIVMSAGVGTMAAQSAPPKKRIARPDSTANPQQSEKTEREQQAAQNKAVQDLIDKELRIQQQIASETEKEISDTQQNADTQRKIGNYTGFLILVGVVQGIVFYFTLKAIRRQANLMEQQIIVPYRARLAIGEFQKPIGNEIRFAIENYGRLAGKITYIDATIIILSTVDGETSFHKSEKFDKTVIPGKESSIALSFRLPNEVNIFGQEAQVLVNGTIDYEVGIKGSDALTFSRLHLGKSEKWITGTPAIELVFADTDKVQN
jgi:hypothetical protein